jgi:exopolyphosphatase/guanosine-5'-triphosphate,3'-diphosphate pyrophosphatase
MEYSTLGAVDLGSNSFHLAIGRVVDDQVYPLDSLKETVRLGFGLTAERNLEAAAQERALATLKRFSERLAGMPREAVRVVGTNALRVAKNSAAFLRRAEGILGFPIEIISGREEARLIYIGVAHSLPPSPENRLVVDIGGGSTEFIIGRDMVPKLMESLYMGCVSYTQRYFPDGKLEKKGLRAAEIAAREQVQTIAARYEKAGWSEVVGSSGTARAIAEALQKNGLAAEGITAAGLAWLREQLLAAGDIRKLEIPGLSKDRVPVAAGGIAIMSGIFAELRLAEMTVADGALRQGVMWDLLGRVHHTDVRSLTIEQFVKRYQVDQAQAARVSELALQLLRGIDDDGALAARGDSLDWAARLHEVGIAIAQAAYHKHSAYVLAYADMPGFSRQEQAWLSNLVLAQRGKLTKMRDAFEADARLAALAFCLRTAVVFHRGRRTLPLPKIEVSRRGKTYRVGVARAWLQDNQLIAVALREDAEEWAGVGVTLEIEEL